MAEHFTASMWALFQPFAAVKKVFVRGFNFSPDLEHRISQGSLVLRPEVCSWYVGDKMPRKIRYRRAPARNVIFSFPPHGIFFLMA
jgi:hypothetical protein